MTFERICIVGLGLIGGSLAKAIRRSQPQSFITAVDTNQKSLGDALSEQIIDKATTDLYGGVKGAELVFVCTPVHVVPSLLREIMPILGKDTVITDVGSTKQEIMKAAEKIKVSNQSQAIFIGGHPMAGTQHSGYQASLAHLFENAYYILTLLDSTPSWAVESLRNLLLSIGALPMVMGAKDHDRVIGAVSHLPHVVAAALVNAVAEMEDTSHLYKKLAAGGFRDITRIASSNPNMWKNICMDNKEELVKHIMRINRHLVAFAQMLLRDEGSKIHDYFACAKTYRENLPVRQALSLLSYYDLYVDVEDRPGVIGAVATILGKHSINIKNLRIINSREGEPGSLIISFSDSSSLDKAQKVLKENSYVTFTK